MTTKEVPQPCGEPDCGCSTGICGNLTFGRGNLDPNGYWEFPCEKCALAFVAAHGTLDTEVLYPSEYTKAMVEAAAQANVDQE